MRVAVVGPEATGKSVLAGRLAEALGLPLMPSPRDLLLRDSGYHTLFEWIAAGNSWSALLAHQVARETGGENAVVDAGVLDQYCLFQRWGWNGSSPDQAERLRELVLEQARRYDRILVTPPRLVAGPAAGRFRSQEHNLQLSRLLAALLRETELDAHSCPLDDGSAEARFAQALAFVTG